MGKAMEIISGRVVAPGAAFVAWTLATGNTLNVRNTDADSPVYLIDLFGTNQADGQMRVHSPRMHDNIQGYRAQIAAAAQQGQWPLGMLQKLIAQDTLTVEQNGSVPAGDIELGSLLFYYEDLPGVNARLLTPDELTQRMVNMLAVENTLALGVTGDYTGEEALNAEFDLLKANTDYAILGCIVSAQAHLVRYRSTDFGNLGVAVPADPDNPLETANYFVNLAKKTGLATIPVFNSANVDSLLVDGVQDENGVDITVSTILAQLD